MRVVSTQGRWADRSEHDKTLVFPSMFRTMEATVFCEPSFFEECR